MSQPHTRDFPAFGRSDLSASPLRRRAMAVLPWVLAVLLPVGAGLVTFALRAYMERNLGLLLLIAVTGVALLGGLGPGLLATTCAAIGSDLFFIAPPGALLPTTTPDRVRLAGFVIVMVGVSVLCDSFRRTLRRLRAREAALRGSEADLRMLLEHASDAIVITDADGAIVDVNVMTCRMSGFGRAELIGQPVRALMVDGDTRTEAGIPQTVTAAFARGEHRLLRKDGRARDLDVSATRFVDGRVLTIARDVTERRRLEAQLRQAQRLEALGQLAGGVAHDFNNFVAAIRGCAELLRLDLPAGADARGDVEEIVRTCDRAAGLTRQLLAFSRRHELEATLVAPDEIVRGMQRMLALLLDRGHTLRLALDAPHVRVLADRGQLEQVLMNLAVNARDAMPDGGVLTIGTSADGDDAAGPRSVALTVTDTGIGIAPEVREHMFEPFFTTKGTHGGTGLGLATIAGIVERAGGTVAVESAPGTGSTFRVVLPVAESSARHELAAGEPAA